MNLGQRLLLILGISLLSVYLALPENISIHQLLIGQKIDIEWFKPVINIPLSENFSLKTPAGLKQGLDLAGGIAVTLKLEMADMSGSDREAALSSAREVIARRVDLFGVAEPQIFTLTSEKDYRLVVELPGLVDSSAALELIGTTAQLEFRAPIYQEATDSGQPQLLGFVQTGLTGKDLKRSEVNFQSQTGDPVVGLTFNEEGKEKFSQLTETYIDKPIAIFLDDQIVTAPMVRAHITTGQAIIEGEFTADEAKQLAIQLNAGALPVPLSVESQHTIAPALGADAVQKSVTAGLVGLGLVMLFMGLMYGRLGLLANLGLVIYGLLNLALYKLIPVTLTLPGIAGFILSVGMAVDSNILIFERFKEEKRGGKPEELALEHAFGRAWDSIKDANIATLITAFILFNPFAWEFLPTSGPVRGFALTLTLGILISLFTGIFVTRTLLRLVYRNP